MATIDEVVEMWDNAHPAMQVEVLKDKQMRNPNEEYELKPNGRPKKNTGKIEWQWYNQKIEVAVIKLSEDFNIGQIHYKFRYLEHGRFYIRFDISKNYFFQTNSNSQAFLDFLTNNVASKLLISGKSLEPYNGKYDIWLAVAFDKNSPAKIICDAMQELIDKTQKSIIDFLGKAPITGGQQMNPNDIVTLLENSKNLILTGAPGTGKTYLAKQIAIQMIGKDGDENEQIGFVQFHPAYDYTDFVEGLRPTPPDENGNIGFRLKSGIFKEFCCKAVNDCKYKDDETFDDEKSKKYIFIIDEINRGEISKIFGELFFSIDLGYRGIDGKVKTQYSNMQQEPNEFDIVLGIENNNYGHFYIPENVYIIGTMNDIDRSVESFDFAMRRRFTWEEITAKQSQRMFDNNEFDEWKTEAIERMDLLNSAIWNEDAKNEEKDKGIEGLNTSYHIGAAYFLKLKKYKGNYAELWKYHLEPLLKEYLRGMPDEKTKLSDLKKAYDMQTPVDDSAEEE